MQLTFSILAGEYFIQIFETGTDSGSVVVTDVKADDAVLIEPYHNISEFQIAIKAMKDLVQPNKNAVVLVTVGEDKWLSTFPITYNWYNAMRIGFVTTEMQDGYSLKNQNVLPLDMKDFDWLDENEEE